MTAAKLQSVKIKFGEKEIELSEDEARGLHAELDKLFGRAPVFPIYIDRQIPVWPSITPIYDGPYIGTPCPNTWPQITCGDDVGLLTDGNMIRTTL